MKKILLYMAGFGGAVMCLSLVCYFIVLIQDAKKYLAGISGMTLKQLTDKVVKIRKK